MKKLKVLSILFAATLLFACNNEKREVERIAQAYLDAETNFRVDEARQYAAPEFMPMLNQIEFFVLPHLSKELLDSLTPNKVTIKETELFGDTAIVSFHSSNPKQESNAQIMMVRNDTTWLVVQQGEKVIRGQRPQINPEPIPEETPADTTAKK